MTISPAFLPFLLAAGWLAGGFACSWLDSNIPFSGEN